MLITLLAFLVLFSVLVFAHELGHFGVAKLFGVRVDEFGLGYPPRLFSLGTWKGTEYTINAVPFGGFVRMGEEDAERPDSLGSQKWYIRAAAIAAGPVMNLVLAVICFNIVFMLGQWYAVGNVIIADVAPNSPAEAAGLQVGDEIIEMNGIRIVDSLQLQQQTDASAGKEATLVVQRGSRLVTVSLVPRLHPPKDEGRMGIQIRRETELIRYPIWRAIPAAVRRTGEILNMIVAGFAGMIRGTVPADVAGPVGIFQATSAFAKSGLASLLEWAAFLSINFFLVNLMPFPGLDGGHLVFILLQGIRGGKRIEPRKESAVHLVGMLILMAFMAFVLYRDILRLIQGDTFMP